MKVDSNMETDRLLHHYAQRSRAASMSGAEQGDSLGDNTARESQNLPAHLDADELSAYAENALPVATRARYTKHLSDCDSCRKLVAELVLSSGVVAELQAKTAPQDQKLERGWRERLAAMLAPRMLRYAASVMVLIGIVAVTFVTFRGGRNLGFKSSESRPNSAAANSPQGGSSTQDYKPDENERTPGISPARKSEDTARPDTVTGASSPATKDQSQSVPVEVQKSGQEQIPAKPPAPASVPNDNRAGERNAVRDEDSELAAKQQPVAGTITADKSKAMKKVDSAEPTGRDASESTSRVRNEESVSTERDKVAESKAPASMDEKSAANRRARRDSENAPASTASGAAMDDRVGRADGAGKAEERRVVGGKQFVRRDGAWIDVAYKSQATTSVKRGSEQYRALVADEPGLRAIANQLSGEVIVVWKGSVYRIH